MSIIIDLIIVIIVAVCIFLGFKRGLTGSLLKILSFVIAIVIAFIFYKPVANYVIDHTIIDESIQESIVSMFSSQEEETTVKEEDKQNMPSVIVDHINEAVEKASNEAKETIVADTARGVAITIVNMGAAILLYIIAQVLLIIVKLFTKFVTDLPIIKQADQVGGVVYGILEALVIIYVIMAVISFISPLLNGFELAGAIEKSFIGSFFYNNNLLLKIIF